MQRNAHRGLTVHRKVHGLWMGSCIFQYRYSTIAPSSYHGFGYWWSLDFARPSPLTIWHNHYVLVMMVDKFSKWIQLALLLTIKELLMPSWIKCSINLAHQLRCPWSLAHPKYIELVHAMIIKILLILPLGHANNNSNNYVLRISRDLRI
jgi:hypothetical protein